MTETLQTDGGGVWPVSWSPDGKSILYVTNSRETSNDIWVLPVGGGMPYPFQQTPASENWAAFSPDGKWVAYSSTASSDMPGGVRDAVPGQGPSWRISADGGSQARWRRDGAEIFYLAPDRRLMAAAVTERNGAMAVTRVDPLFTLTFPTAPITRSTSPPTARASWSTRCWAPTRRRSRCVPAAPARPRG